LIEWTEQALCQLDYARLHRPFKQRRGGRPDQGADRRKYSTTHGLPHVWKIRPSLGHRELVIWNTSFIAAYTIDRDRIAVLAIYHGSQRWPEAC
jgi:hypothetical protein